MPTLPSLQEMLKAGLHFGHQQSRWHPKMKPFIFGVRNGIHVIDLDKTTEELTKALAYVKDLAANGKTVLFVGTKRQARGLVQTAAETCGSPYLVERWIGGLLTNFEECKRRLKKYKTLQEMFATGEIEKYTKKEQGEFKKQIEKMDKYLKGLTQLESIPDALYVADIRVEKTAVTEANKTGTPMIAVVDSNVNPEKVSFPIPGNDDAVQAIALVANLVSAAITEGKAEYESKRAAMVVEKPAVSAGQESSSGQSLRTASGLESSSTTPPSTTLGARAKTPAKKERSLVKETSV